MEHKETFIQRRRRWWQSKKLSLYGFFERSPKPSPLFEGTKGGPLFHVSRPNLPEITFSVLAETGQAESIPVLNQRSYTRVISSTLTDTSCADLGIDAKLPEITLSALAETGQAELTIPVLDQRSYTRVISSTLADTSCADLGIDAKLPDITLSALTETGKAESTIPVLKQRSYTGSRVITSSLANTPCAALGIDGVLDKLNITLGSSYTLNSVISVLDSYVAQNSTFGTVYAYLRPYWDNIHTIEHELHTREEEDWEMRKRVLVHDRITTRQVPPRRVWDLYANRVVPYWVVGKYPWGISHAWVGEKDRVDVMTPINGYEWPVPMPKDVNLDLIRIEMLNLGARYAWLDVLCLRQVGGENEHLRLEEWKLDVPTIGWVYRAIDVVCYFNGLGRPLDLTPDYFESHRCWFRRAWTLQEVTNETIIGGKTGNDIMEMEVQQIFDEQLAHLRKMRKRDFALELVSEMQYRVSTNSLDKVAGLAYLLQSEFIPIYNVEKSDEDAWEVLMDTMSPACRAELFFYFPICGNGSKYWQPSWQQIMTLKHLVPDSFPWPGYVQKTKDTNEDWYEGYFIKSAYVQGLAERWKKGKPRQGKVVFKDAVGSYHIFKILADHMYKIPDGLYALIGSSHGIQRYNLNLWVVGRIGRNGRFVKLSVFHSANDELENLRELLFEKVKIVLC